MLFDEENQNETVENAGEPQTPNPVVDEKEPQKSPADNSGEKQESKPILNEEQKAYVTELMKKRVERNNSRFYERYGVKDLTGLDELFGKASKFDEISAQLEKLTGEKAQLVEQISFIRNNINPDKYDDIRRYFKGGDVAFSEATLIELLPTHPEWIKSVPQNPTAKTTIQTLSPSRGHTVEETEEEKMKRVYGI